MEIIKGQPLMLPNGDVLLPDVDASGSKVLTKEDQEEQAAMDEISDELIDMLDNTDNVLENLSVTRTLADIDIPFEQMNVYMLIVSYKLWGLNSFAIGKLLGVDPSRVESLMLSETYDELQRDMIEAIRAAETSTVHGYIAQNALMAARTVVGSLRNKSSDVRMSAAKDILDRSGFRPVDRVEHTMKYEDEMRIRIITESEAVPTINLTIGDDNGDSS